MRTRIYKELVKAQNYLDLVNENSLFDLCQYHINIIESDDYFADLNTADKEQILTFAKDCTKIAILRKGLNPIV